MKYKLFYVIMLVSLSSHGQPLFPRVLTKTDTVMIMNSDKFIHSERIDTSLLLYFNSTDLIYYLLSESGPNIDKVEFAFIDEKLPIRQDSVFLALSKLKNLKYLEMRYQDTIYPEIGLLTNLEWLSINNGTVRSIPKEIGKLTGLKCLILGYIYGRGTRGNRLNSLPDEIVNLQQLQTIYLDNNEFTEFPEILCYIQNLNKIYINSNKLSAIPGSIKLLYNLKEIYLHSNNFSKFPKKLCKLKKLQVIHLENSQIKLWPIRIKKNKGLIVVKQ